MRHDVVWMPITTVRVIGEYHVRPVTADYLHESSSCLLHVYLRKGMGGCICLPSLHTGVMIIKRVEVGYTQDLCGTR
jgi:hypothetical protein